MTGKRSEKCCGRKARKVDPRIFIRMSAPERFCLWARDDPARNPDRIARAGFKTSEVRNRQNREPEQIVKVLFS
jgi:hypothetical protein